MNVGSVWQTKLFSNMLWMLLARNGFTFLSSQRPICFFFLFVLSLHEAKNMAADSDHHSSHHFIHSVLIISLCYLKEMNVLICRSKLSCSIGLDDLHDLPLSSMRKISIVSSLHWCPQVKFKSSQSLFIKRFLKTTTKLLYTQTPSKTKEKYNRHMTLIWYLKPKSKHGF